MLIFSIKSKTCHKNKQTFKTNLFCSCLFSGRITTAINTANDYTDDVLQNGFGTNPVWLIREKVMSASRNNLEYHSAMKTLASLKKSAIPLLELLEMKIPKALQPLKNTMDEISEFPKAEIAAVHSDPSSVEGLEPVRGQAWVNSLMNQSWTLQLQE